MVQNDSYGVEVCAMAMARNISVELLSGKIYTLAVRPDMNIEELKEEVKVGSGQAPSHEKLFLSLSSFEISRSLWLFG